MLKRILIMSVLLIPTASWAACTSKKIGTMSLDCSAQSQVLNDAAVSSVTLLPQSDTAMTPAAFKRVRAHEILDMSGQVNGTRAKAPKDTVSTPVTPDSGKAAKPK